MKLLTVVGARPQFVKAAMLSAAIRRRSDGGTRICEVGIHTGQHYDPSMSDVFFEEMQIPEPAANLKVGSGSHGETTGRMLEGLEKEMLRHRPDWVVLYGDTNSTAAGALAAAKLNIPIAHIEAGLRSFNRAMPEEINRIVTDHLSQMLLCPTHRAALHLKNEGIVAGVHHVGDIMYDAALAFGAISRARSRVLEELEIETGNYFLSTVHRAENTDNPERLRAILEGLGNLTGTAPVVLPIHPRTRRCIEEQGIGDLLKPLRVIDPVPFLDMVELERSARCILTDSGGVQKEAYFHRVPCLTLRDETEWGETVDTGWNRIVGANREAILGALKAEASVESITDYGDGTTADQILDLLLSEK